MPMTLRMSDTWRTVLETPRMAGSHSAILVHLYPPGPGMGVCHPLTDREVVIGRGDDCDLTIAEQSVSRRHARIEFGAQGYVVADLQSTNGTFVNDQPVTQCALRDGDYLRVGSCIYRFLSGSNIEAEYHEEIYRLIIFDALTDVPNKRHLSEFLDRELARTLRHRRPLSVALLDIDRFKALNDQRGHLAGDYTLRELAACVKNCIRREELFARYGGEEFVLVLPETPLDQAIATSERIRELVEHHPFRYENEVFYITISTGVVCTQGVETLTSQELIRRADAKLYQAKREGSNCVRA